MKNRIILFGLISFLFLCLFIGCKKQETNNNIDEEIQIESIIDPKEWFYASKQSRIKQDPLNTIDQNNGVTKNSKGLVKEEKLPKWSEKREKTIKNTQIFEYAISYKVMNLFIPSSIKNSSEKKRYSNSIVNKAVFIKKKDGFSLNVISFLPDPEYLKMSGYNTSKYSFIDFDTNYTGAILIYNWNSELIKAYNYKNGKKIGDIKISWETNNAQIKKENPCGIAEPYEQWYRICTGFIVGDVYEDEYCIEGYNQQLNFDFSGCSDTNVPNNTCDDPTTPMNECDQTPGDFFGPPEPTTQVDPCTDAQPVVNASNLLSQNSTFLNSKNNIQNADPNFEHSYTFGTDANGNTTSSPMTTCTSRSNCTVNTSWQGAFADLHNHPDDQPPSPGDMYGLIDRNNQNSSYNTRMVITPNGSVFALVVLNLITANTFKNNYPAVNNGFGPDFPDEIFNKFQDVVDVFMQQGLGKLVSEERAMSYVLDKYNTGIVLLKKENNGSFKRLKTDESIANGSLTYISNNCQ